MTNSLHTHQINVQWAPKIVWVEITGELPCNTKTVGVKFREVGGDKGKALELAIERLLS